MRSAILMINFFAMTILAKSEEDKPDNHKLASSALATVLSSNKTGSWDKFFAIHSASEQEKMLEEAFVRLSIMAEGKVPASQPAKSTLQRYFDKSGAELEIKNSGKALSSREKIIVVLSHIRKPEMMYKEWRDIEENFDETKVHLDIRKRVASDTDFKLTANNQTAVALGKKDASLKIEFINGTKGWKVKKIWNIYLTE